MSGFQKIGVPFFMNAGSWGMKFDNSSILSSFCCVFSLLFCGGMSNSDLW